ncbi:adenylyl cyclase [Arthrobacter sp. YAF34]|uniref:adenylyl cyclase n=1 Tax=Arthrobacter sp. YAF34 TaxID=3233083 RepID=UPI003F93CC14
MAAAALAAALGVFASAPAAVAAPATSTPDLGPNVVVFTPDMPQAQIQAKVDAIAKQQVDSEMGTGRYALLFEPGTYGSAANPLVFQVGYYTEVAGLGASPDDVTINGHVDVYNRCTNNGTSNCIALDNFWRSVSNLHINAVGGNGCHGSAEFWAVSQAAPMRRVHVTGQQLSFMDYCTGPSYASGGFLADSKAESGIVNGSQQQFYTRDSSVSSWSNAVWNQVFSGVQGAPAQSFPNPPYTTLAATPAVREKPYLVHGDQGLAVVAPSAKTNSSGAAWATGGSSGRSIPLSDFFVAKPGDSISRINAALAGGKNLLLTPGVYSVDQSIRVKRAGTVVLGLGLATLTAEGGSTPLVIDDVPGVDVAGVTVDAGPVNSPVLIQVGTKHQRGRGGSSAADPISMQDVFLRVGGAHAGKATVGVQVDSDNVLLDDLWLWRADHGIGGVGWTQNTSDTGLVVNGDDVTATGLFVEHFQKYNVIWNGEQGKTVFFQNELPYDAPNQAAWQHGSTLGYAAYKVADTVKTHELWGGGSYIFTNVDPSLHASHAFEVPQTAGVKLHDLSTVSLNGAGTIDHVINDTGGAVTPTHQGPETVTTYGG